MNSETQFTFDEVETTKVIAGECGWFGCKPDTVVREKGYKTLDTEELQYLEKYLLRDALEYFIAAVPRGQIENE